MVVFKPTPEDEKRIYEAWKSGKMLPSHVSKYEADLEAGIINLPPDVTLTPKQIRNLSMDNPSL